MRTNTTRLASLACALLGAMHGALPASSAEASRRIKPLNGISLNVGDKNAVAYFRQEKGDCRVTLTLGETTLVPTAASPGSARVSMAIAPGSTTVVETAGGDSLNLTCADGAAELSLQ